MIAGGRQRLAISRQHHPGSQLQKERPEEMIMGEKDLRFPWDPRHPVCKLPEGRQKKILMAHKDWRFSRTPGSTIKEGE